MRSLLAACVTLTLTACAHFTLNANAHNRSCGSNVQIQESASQWPSWINCDKALLVVKQARTNPEYTVIFSGLTQYTYNIDVEDFVPALAVTNRTAKTITVKVGFGLINTLKHEFKHTDGAEDEIDSAIPRSWASFEPTRR